MGGFCSKREVAQKDNQLASEMPSGGRQSTKKGSGHDLPEAASKKKGSSLGEVLTTTTKKAKETVALTARKGAATVQRAGSLVRDSLDGIGSALTGGTTTYGSGIFTTGGEPKGKRVIGILAFEVASVIVKAMNIKVSLGEEDMEEFRQTVLNSTGVRTLVSEDENVVWKIAASDKRAELQVFISEVIRLGKLAEDPQWRQLERVFMRVAAVGGPGPKLSAQHLENELANLENLVATTGDLYHELHGLDSLQSNLKRRQDEEDAFPGSQRADTLPALRLELRQQEKEVKQLKKKSLWNKRLDQIVELLVDMVFYIHQQMVATFGVDVMIAVDKERRQGKKDDMLKLGVCGLALHYSNIVNAVDNMVSRPNSVAPNSRDSLYQMLPPKMKTAVRGRILRMKEDDDEESATVIRGKLDEILNYIVPMAGNTIRYFSDKRLQGHSELQLLQTLHHADQRIADAKLLDLVVGLHYLISRAKGTQLAQAKALTKSQILNSTNIQLPGLPLLQSHSGLAPGLQLPPPKSAFQMGKQFHNIKNSAELGIHYPGGLPPANGHGQASPLGGSPHGSFKRNSNDSSEGRSSGAGELASPSTSDTATTTTFAEEGVAVIPVPAPQGTAPVTVADALAKAAELADMDAGYRSDGSTASSSGEKRGAQTPADGIAPATTTTGVAVTSGRSSDAPLQVAETQGGGGRRSAEGPSSHFEWSMKPPINALTTVQGLPRDTGPGYEFCGKPPLAPTPPPPPESEMPMLPELVDDVRWAVGSLELGGDGSAGKSPTPAAGAHGSMVDVPQLIDGVPEYPADPGVRQKALSAGASPALSPLSKRTSSSTTTWVSPRLLTSSLSLSKKRPTPPPPTYGGPLEEWHSGGESGDETSPRGSLDKHRRLPSFSRKGGPQGAGDQQGRWTASASGPGSGVSADISQISWPIGRPEVQRQGLSVRAAKMDAAMRREEITRGVYEAPVEQQPGIDISWPVGRPGGAVRVMSRAEASRLVTGGGAGGTGLPPAAPAPASAWVSTPRLPGLPNEMSRSTSAPAIATRGYDHHQSSPFGQSAHVIDVPRSSSARAASQAESGSGIHNSPHVIPVPRTSRPPPQQLVASRFSFGTVGSLNLVSVDGGAVASADSLGVRLAPSATFSASSGPETSSDNNAAPYEFQWQPLYGSAGGSNRNPMSPRHGDPWNRDTNYSSVVISPVPASVESGHSPAIDGNVSFYQSAREEAGRGGSGYGYREQTIGGAPAGAAAYGEDAGVATGSAMSSGVGGGACEALENPYERADYEKGGSPRASSSFAGRRTVNGEGEGFRIKGSGARTATVVPQSGDPKLRAEDLLPMLMPSAQKQHSKRDSFRQYYTWQQQASAGDESYGNADIAQLTAIANARGTPVPKSASLPGGRDQHEQGTSSPRRRSFERVVSPTGLDATAGYSWEGVSPLDAPQRSASSGHSSGSASSGRLTPQRRQHRSQNPHSLSFDIDRIGS